MIASIPSPSFNSIDIGPLSLNMYGLAIALGVVAAVWLFGRRLEARGAGTADDASAIAIWAVLAGVVGARLYHVITDWRRFAEDDGWFEAVKICTGYRLDGRPIDFYPDRSDILARVEPVYETLPGWQADLSEVREPDDLPEAARAFLAIVEREVGVPVNVVGVGAERDDYLLWTT